MGNHAQLDPLLRDRGSLDRVDVLERQLGGGWFIWKGVVEGRKGEAQGFIMQPRCTER